jgi:hypothetical protein
VSTPIDLEQQLACVRREIGMRRRVYPRWVQAGRMSQAAADREIATMEAVLDTLTKVRSLQPGLML